MSEIRIYVEGGRPGDEARYRKAFNAFLAAPIQRVREKRIQWQVIPSKSRNQAYDAFCYALIDHPNSINVLLVDAEAFVAKRGMPWEHLKLRDNWDRPDADDNRCHLMVVTMEAWFIADREILTKHFRKPLNLVDDIDDIERVPKQKVEQIMEKLARELIFENTTRSPMAQNCSKQFAPTLYAPSHSIAIAFSTLSMR